MGNLKIAWSQIQSLSYVKNQESVLTALAPLGDVSIKQEIEIGDSFIIQVTRYTEEEMRITIWFESIKFL